jgi:hypothetical protein
MACNTLPYEIAAAREAHHAAGRESLPQTDSVIGGRALRSSQHATYPLSTSVWCALFLKEQAECYP